MWRRGSPRSCPKARRTVARRAEAINARLGALSATDASDIRLAQGLDVRFHRCYEQAAPGPRLLAKLVALHARRERYVRVYTEALVHTHSVQESLDEHGAIVAAIARATRTRPSATRCSTTATRSPATGASSPSTGIEAVGSEATVRSPEL